MSIKTLMEMFGRWVILNIVLLIIVEKDFSNFNLIIIFIVILGWTLIPAIDFIKETINETINEYRRLK